MSHVRAVGTIALNELRHVGRDRTALFFALVLPVLIILVIGTTFGGAEALRLGVVDHDGSDRSADLVASLDGADGIAVETVGSLDDLRREVRAGDVDAGLVVPAGYGERLDGSGGARVELVADPTSNDAVAAQAAVEGTVAEEAARTAAADLAAERAGVDVEEARATADALAADLPRVEVDTVTLGDGDEDDERDDDLGVFSYTVPSNLVLFVFVNTVAVGALLATDRARGITHRLLATPHGTGTILAGIGSAKLLFALLQSALLLGVGVLLFGVDLGDPLGAALVVVLFAAVATAVGLVVGSVVSDPDQAQSLAIPVAIGMGMLGGCMWPLDVVPPVMRTVGHLVPHAWAMDAWVALVFDGAGVADILPQLAVLAGFALGLGLLARDRLRRSLTG